MSYDMLFSPMKIGNVEIENVPRYDSLLECIKTVLEKR